VSTTAWILLAVCVGVTVGVEAFAWMRHRASLIAFAVGVIVLVSIGLAVGYGMFNGVTGWDPIGLMGSGTSATGGGASMRRCDPNYDGSCLRERVSDYDCAGGSGDGPLYTGAVRVIGQDVYGLDRDGDGYACE
jgi:hypothetical protein